MIGQNELAAHLCRNQRDTVVRISEAGLLWRDAAEFPPRLHALDYLVIEATRHLEKEPKGGSFIASHPAVMRAKEILDGHPAENWKLAELARMAGLSLSRLSECFMRDTGMSPHQYLLCARIEVAKELLNQSDVSVTDLALDLGFSSSQHFASTFKRMTGDTAQSFRNRIARLKTLDVGKPNRVN